MRLQQDLTLSELPFLESCQFDEERKPAGSNTEVVGNKTLLGQIASFMDSLHLTYDEVVNQIPYRNLIIMQKDKQHEAFGDVVKKISGKELANRRRK